MSDKVTGTLYTKNEDDIHVGKCLSPDPNNWENEPAITPAKQRLVSYSIPAPDVSPALFLQEAKGLERFFWQDAQEAQSDTIFAGFGAAANLFAWGAGRIASIQEQAKALFKTAVILNNSDPAAAPRLFGGFSFRKDAAPDNTWASFHPAHFILPHYQLVQHDGASWLTINALIPADENPQENEPTLKEALTLRYQALQAATLAAQPPVAPAEQRYPMAFPAWEQMLDGAIDEIKNGRLQKVVLSRVSELRFTKNADVDSAMAYLGDQYADCYRFLFEPRPHHAFFGATPELLAKVNGRTIHTMALAGSIGRGTTDHDDDLLGSQLINSPKDRHEHDLVVQSILGRLAPLTSQLEIAPQPGLYKLSNIQHLYSPVRGKLLQGNGILPIIKALHPTPALGGSPRKKAMAFISEAESVTRGWYGAPVGWIDVNLDGAFAVGIRSAVAQEKRVWLYAGAGIVADSEPEKEWDETGLKFMPILNAFGV